MELTKSILNRLNASSKVTIVEDCDEVLAMQACKAAGEAFAPGKVQVMSVLAPGFLKQLADFKDSGSGVFIVSDLLRTLGSRPDVPRIIREYATQTRDKQAHLIMLETPGVDIPAGIKGDVDVIIPKLPTVTELKEELENFINETGIKVDGNGEARAAIANALAGLARHEASRLMALCWVENKSLDAKWLRTAKAQRIQEQSGKALSFVDTTNVPILGGAEVMQAWLDVTKAAFASDKAKAYGLPEPKGIVLVGVPGTGKSLTPKNVARSWGLPLIRLDIGAVYGGLVGATESNMRNVLEAIRACAPCVLWVDEIEKALGGKGGSSGDSGVSDRVAGSLLTFMQENEAPIFIIATANSVENLRPELLRKGRIDEIFFVDLPDLQERESIAKIHVERRKRDVNILKPSEIAALCDGFSGAEIEQAILDAMKKSFSQGREVTIDDIKEAVQSTTPLSKTMEKDITALRTWAKGKARYANKKAAEVSAANGGRNLPSLGDGWKLK